MEHYYTKVEDWMKQAYGSTAERYRRNDEADATGPDHQRICQTLGAVCSSFNRRIAVLDVGCGTGRYFHCLRNVENLVGIDVSAEMLELARNPVKSEEVTAENIDLRVGNAYLMDFPTGSFDIIMSIGVFGNGCPFEAKICTKFFKWLKPGGKLFFDTFDLMDVPFWQRTRIKARRAIYQRLPASLQQRWDQRSGWLPFYGLSKSQVSRILRDAGFTDIKVESQLCALDLGKGRKLEALATKPA